MVFILGGLISESGLISRGGLKQSFHYTKLCSVHDGSQSHLVFIPKTIWHMINGVNVKVVFTFRTTAGSYCINIC